MLTRQRVLGLILFSATLANLFGCTGSLRYKHPADRTQLLCNSTQIRCSDFSQLDREESEEAFLERPTLAVVTLEDARSDEHKAGMTSWIEEYGGFTGEEMTADRVYAQAMTEMVSDAIADALESTGRFSKVFRVTALVEAEADLVLVARLRRLRGWQAYRAERGKESRVLESLGDAFIDEIKIVDLTGEHLVFVGQVGAMVDDAELELNPYSALERAFGQMLLLLVEQIESLDLGRIIEEEVRLDIECCGDLRQLLNNLPGDWELIEEGITTPTGWSGDGDCPSLRLADSSRWFFHPHLGSYNPNMELWVCPADWSGSINISNREQDRFAARVIGVLDDMRPVFARSLGKSSWPRAFEDVGSYLGLCKPYTEPLLSLPINASQQGTMQIPGLDAPGF